MKASDYIVEYIVAQGVTDVFGYPGGMVTHFMDSLGKYKDKIKAHLTYNEQGAAMAACGYAQTSGITGVAYATSGPGATNMITGICNAYMDSIPTLFITGQVNSFEQKGDLKVRQRGFQETDIVAMVRECTKYAKAVTSAVDLKSELDKAFQIANDGRKGPVLLDIAMDVFRTDIEPEEISEVSVINSGVLSKDDTVVINELVKKSIKPVMIVGNGLERTSDVNSLLNSIDIPVVTSMLAVDFRSNLDNYYGFVGAYGDRTANFIVAKSDLVIAIGARLDVRQVGGKRENFAPNSRIIRIDIDSAELEYKVHDDEYSFCANANTALKCIVECIKANDVSYSKWIETCNYLKDKLQGIDDKSPNKLITKISEMIPEDRVITTDVGQNQVWVAQSFNTKKNQRILFSGGHGAMGYSLPAAIGAQLASGKIVYSFNGDGGIQMNIQELQTIAREKLPIKIFIFNNNALGMIRHFQEMYFKDNYFQTVPSGGFTSPDFEKVAFAYGLGYKKIETIEDVDTLRDDLDNNNPEIIEVKIHENTYVFPKLEFGKPNQDQEPLLDRVLFNELMKYGNE